MIRASRRGCVGGCWNWLCWWSGLGPPGHCSLVLSIDIAVVVLVLLSTPSSTSRLGLAAVPWFLERSHSSGPGPSLR